MKIVLLGIISLFSASLYAQCLTVKFIAYEVECRNSQCIAPTLAPYPIRIEFDLNKVGTYKYSRSLGNIKVESSLTVKEVNSGYNLEIKTEYANQNGHFGEVKDFIQTQDLSSFQAKEIKGNSILVGSTQYYPRVGVFPEPHKDLCQ